MLNSLFDVLRIDDQSRVAYLTPLVELSKSQTFLTVATLNYDRKVENVAELCHVSCDTLIERWLESGRLLHDGVGLKLLKLHGSINWIFEDAIRYLQHEHLPHRRLRQVDPTEKHLHAAPAVVFGEAGKLRAEGPFLELLLTWSAELQKSDGLLVVGYSFRDQHVNELIARWFNGDSRRRIIVVDPAELTSDRDDRRGFVDYLGYMATAERREETTERDACCTSGRALATACLRQLMYCFNKHVSLLGSPRAIADISHS